MFNTPHELLVRVWDKTLRKYRAPEIENIWQMGICDAEYPGVGAIGYVTGYVNKQLSEIGLNEGDDRTPAKNYISQGLGTGYLTPGKIGYYKKRLTPELKLEDGKKIPMPRLYKQKIYNEDELKKISIASQKYALEKEEFRNANHEVSWKKREIEKEKEKLYKRNKGL